MFAMSLPLVALSLAVFASAAQTFRIATYNLRFDALPDSITVNQSLASIPDPLTQIAYLNKTGEQPWSQRRLYIAERISAPFARAQYRSMAHLMVQSAKALPCSVR